ncbi:hypothetical protein TNCT_527711 [Trichonephila clavata]|uniref:BTB domain-containing protein n=1 Tax=Trichonephila clavata TaxID=2740835 RepID=A0A8X6GIR2_TRICU|nr:hypothetical protein TNCT_527711 [Trichonephila clavata]
MTTDIQNRKDAFTFIWRIQNFCYNSHHLFQTLTSPSFHPNKMAMTRWKLILKASECSTSCYIQRDFFDNGPEVFTINFETSVLAPDGSAIESTIVRKKDTQFKRNSVFPTIELLTAEILQNERDVYLPQDVLTIQCKMWTDRSCCEIERVYARSTLCTERDLIVQRFELFSSERSYMPSSFQIKSKSKDWLVMCVKMGLIAGSDENEKIKAEIKVFNLFKTCKFICNVHLLDAVGKKTQCGFVDTRYGVSDNDLSFLPIPLPYSKKEMIDRKSEYLPNDELCLQFEFLFANGVIQNEIERTDYDLQLKPAHIPTTSDFHNTPLSNSLYSLYDKQEFCDVELKTKTSTFHAHKLVLCAVSSVFKSKLTNEELANTSGCIQIDDLDDEILDLLLHFLYTGNLENLQWETAGQLYHAAGKYDVHLLKAHCEAFLMRALDTSNASETLVLADKQRDSFLKDFVVNFILQHDEEIFPSDSWKYLTQSNIELALQTMLLKYRKSQTN